MAIFTYSDVKKHIQSWGDDLRATLAQLEEILIQARDNENVPIYSTKWRLKSASSAYLKARSKTNQYDSLDEITDFGGLRMLCMYEQDIRRVHDFFIRKIIKNEDLKLNLIEYKTFNWEHDDNEKMNTIVANAGLKESIIPPESSKKESGYRSVHYLIKLEKYSTPITIEIQLRTLLQDVWSEIEHSLSYKNGIVDPYIKRNFLLLAESLKTNDSLVAHLYDISAKQKKINHSHALRSKPYRIFSYDPALDSSLFESKPGLLYKRKEYESYISNNISVMPPSTWIEEAKNQLDKINNELDTQDIRADQRYKYWEAMERAFLDFHGSNLNKASKQYKKIMESGKAGKGLRTYVTSLRYGEIQFILGNTKDALEAFDDADLLCRQHIENESGRVVKFKLDLYRIKIKLANIYWHLGRKFYQISLDEIKEAESIYNQIKDDIEEDENERDKEKLSLNNNLCWYYLEDFLCNNNEDSYNYAKKSFIVINEIIEKNKSLDLLNLNVLDTLAWFSFQTYLKENNAKMLIQAKEFLEDMQSTSIPYRSTLQFFSNKIHLNHYETILSES